MPSESRDRLTILRAQAGDRQALDQALRLLQEPLFRYLRFLAGDPSLAEDILQEVMVIVYRKIRWLRDPDLFLPWAYRIATREAFHRMRRERRWQDQVHDDDLLDSLAAPGPHPGESDAVSELVPRLPELVAQVSPASRAVLLLHYWDEMSIEATAAILGIAVGTAKSRLAYGLATMRRLLAEGEGEPVSGGVS
jgi:RNA polymerase sigma factor (sigma-70 family)